MTIPLRGELWKIRTPLIEKDRPALVITPGKDNATNGGAIVIPTSTGGFRSNAAMLRLQPPEAGVQETCFLLPNMLHFLEFETCVIEITPQGYKQVKDKRFKTFIKKLGELDRDRLEDIEMYLYRLLGLSALD